MKLFCRMFFFISINAWDTKTILYHHHHFIQRQEKEEEVNFISSEESLNFTLNKRSRNVSKYLLLIVFVHFFFVPQIFVFPLSFCAIYSFLSIKKNVFFLAKEIVYACLSFCHCDYHFSKVNTQLGSVCELIFFFCCSF